MSSFDRIDVTGLSSTYAQAAADAQLAAEAAAETSTANATATAANAAAAEGFRDEAEAFRNAAHDISNIEVPDEVMATVDADDESAFRVQQDARLAVAVTQAVAATGAGADVTVSETVAAATTYTLDPVNAQYFALTFTGNAALADSGFGVGQAVTVEVIQDPSGGRAVEIPDTWVQVDTVSLHTTANTFDILVVWKSPTGMKVRQLTTAAPIALPFTPDLLLDKVAWYDAATIAGDAGDPVELWANQWDERDLVRPAIQGIPHLAIVNGENVVSFDGIDDCLVTGTGTTAQTWVNQPYTGAMTYAMLVKAVAGSTGGLVPVLSAAFGPDSTSEHQIFVATSATGNWTLNAGTNLSAGVANTQDWMVVIAIVNGASSAFDINGSGTTPGNAGTEATKGLRVAKNAAGAVVGELHLHELVIVHHAAGSTERDALFDYLQAKRAVLMGS